jgi:AcrR family transcriptional regulator
VTITLRPVMSGRFVVCEVVMSNNVVVDNNAVNDNFNPLPSAPVNERPYHHGNLRQALLEQAERTVRDRGVQELSLRELAREVGVSHGAPRRHFPDRQALLDALAEAGYARLGAELRSAADAAGEEFEARLQATAAAYVRFATRDAALLELMFAGKHRDDSGLDQAADRAFAVVLELIEQGQAQGALEPGDPERVGLALFATIQGMASLLSAGIVRSEQLDELLTDAIARFLRGSRLPIR